MDGASPAVEEMPPNPDVVVETPGYYQGFERQPFKNVLYIKHEFNADDPTFYAAIPHPCAFIPQDNMLQLCKYLFVVPKEVKFITEDVFGMNDFKLDNNSKTLIYIQDIKLDVYEGKGDLTSACQFYPFPKVED